MAEQINVYETLTLKSQKGFGTVDIVVLLKQVPATESMIDIADDGRSIKTENIKWIVNPYDEIAVEEALRIREAQGGTVTIVSVGTDKAVEAIRVALAMGADKGILVNDPAALECDSIGTARVLAAAIKSLPHDLIIAGMRAVDDDNYQIGAAVAEILDIPHISMAMKTEITDNQLKCQCSVDGGTAVVQAPMPVLFTTQRGLNEPRYTSLPGIMKAKKKPLEKKSLGDIGLSADDLGTPKTKIISLSLPPQRQGGRIIEGETAAEKVEQLVTALKNEAKVI